jgi:glycosyltransferase involved in cell wall biosynthesis
MRIWQVVSNSKWTGAADPVLSVAKGLKARGHDVWISCIRGRSLEKRVVESGVPQITTVTLDRRLGIRGFLSDMENIGHEIRSKGIEIIHANLSHDHWLCGLCVRRHGLPVKIVRTRHASVPIGMGPFSRLLFGVLSDGIIDVCLQAYTVDRRRFGDRKVVWIQGGVDVHLFNLSISGQIVRSKIGLRDGSVLCGIIAHLHDNRGHRQLLTAFKNVSLRFDNARLFIVGKGWYEPRLRSLVNRMGINKRVYFWSDYRFEWQPALAALDIAIYLAEGSEASGRAVLEAMAMGKPVIATAVGAVPQTVADGVSGIVISPNDTRMLSNTLIELISDPEKRARMGTNGRSIVEERFRSETRAEKIESFYGSILDA